METFMNFFIDFFCEWWNLIISSPFVLFTFGFGVIGFVFSIIVKIISSPDNIFSSSSKHNGAENKNVVLPDFLSHNDFLSDKNK